MKFAYPFILVMLLGLIGCEKPVTQLYVGTNAQTKELDAKVVVFNSIQAALDETIKIQKENEKSLVVIHILEGEYWLSSPLKISPEHGPLRIVGQGSDKTIVKGSKLIKLQWEKFDNHIWTAQLDANEDFDQLFVNGKQQVLARYPNYDELGGHWLGHASDAISKERVKTWENPQGALVHAMHSGEWGGFHYKASGVDEEGELILNGGHQNNRPSKMHEKYRMVENVFEELDNPGEWFLDENFKLFYWPLKDMELEDAKIEIVQQKHLLEIIGTEENPIQDISVQGIRFEHAQRTLMEEYEPLLRSDWTIYRGAAVFLEGTKDISIDNCEFANLGGNVIFVSNYNRGVAITNNHIHDSGASAISFVGNSSAVRSPSFQYGQYVALEEIDTLRGPKTNNYPSNSRVDNNLIYSIGRVEKQTAGVQIAMAMKITVSNNSIYDVPRAGINIGDGTWGGHIIEYNDVFNTVLESGDHGAFNSWGRDRFWHPNRDRLDQIVADNPEMPKWDAIHTTVIRNNRFRCDHGWDIDLDDGSSNYHIYNNVCLNGGLKLREGFNRIAENNILVNNGFHPHVWFKNSEDIFRRNIVFTEHRDIRLQGWGKEVDYNFFPDKETLEKTQEKDIDTHSIYGDPLFVRANSGNYALKEESPVYKIGFKSFDTNSFGVKNQKLKSLAKTPEIPTLFFGLASQKKTIHKWLGSTIKSIETMAERSASGLNKTTGVIVLSINDNSVIGRSAIEPDDVIVSCEGEEIKTVADLMKSYQKNNWLGKLDLKIFRNQKEITITLSTK